MSVNNNTSSVYKHIINATPVDGSQITGDVTVDTIVVDTIAMGNIQISGNEIESTDTNGNINLIPNGAGEVTVAADPVTNFGVVTKQYADNIAGNLDPKDSCRIATTSSLDAIGNGTWVIAGGPGVGKTITAGAVGTSTIDTILLADGDRILVKDEPSVAVNNLSDLDNGIYVASATGAGSATVLTRAIDQDGSPANEVSAGNYTFVELGASNANTGWVVIGDGIIAVDVVSINWVQFTGAVVGTLSISNGGTGQTTLPTDGQLLIGGTTGSDLVLGTLTGTASRLGVTNGTNSITLDIDSAYVGQTSITTLGTVTSGTWNGGTIAVAQGGTGAVTLAADKLLTGNGTSAVIAEANLSFDGSTLSVTGDVDTSGVYEIGSVTVLDVAGFGNTFVGPSAGASVTSGVQNTYVGENAGDANISGNSSTFIGYNAGTANTTSGNTFVGDSAGAANVTGTGNTFIGRQSGQGTTASSNTFVGENTGFSNVSGSGNVFIGSTAGQNNTASSNTFIGNGAGFANTIGTRNVYIGRTAAQSATEGSFNVTMGSEVANALSTGSNNTFIGFGAGQSITTQSGNVFIGSSAALGEATFANQLVLANGSGKALIAGEFNNNNVAFCLPGNEPADYGGGNGVIFLADAGTNPSTNPTAGGLIYIDGTSLNYRDTAGTVTDVTSINLASGVTGTLAETDGGTGTGTYTTGDILYSDAANSLAKLAAVATGNALISQGAGTAPVWGDIDLTTTVSGILPTANGGTSIDTSSATGVPIVTAGTWTTPTRLSAANGGTDIDTSAASGAASVSSGTWSISTLSVPNGGTGAVTHTSGNVLLGAGTGAVTSAKVAPTGDFVGTSDVQTLTNKTIDTASNTITVSASDIGSGTISVTQGGTGAVTLTANGVLTGDGTSPIIAESNLTFDGTLLTVSGNLSVSGGIRGSSAQFSQSNGTAASGGTATTGSWQVRQLNTTDYTIGSDITRSGTDITLVTVGTYRIQAHCIAYRVNGHICRFVNTTESPGTIVLYGTRGYSANGGDAQNSFTHLIGQVTTTVINTEFQLQHDVQTTHSTTGFGQAGYTPTDSPNTIYAQIYIERLS